MRAPILEGWRGVAALLVVLAHYGPALNLSGPLISIAFTGVDIFFVISGFVFAPVLLGGVRQHWIAFAIRRVTRILPAYWLALAGYTLLHWYQHQSTGPWAQHLLFLQLESRETAFALNPAFWSLVPEAQFYLLLPLLAWLIAGRPERLWVLALVALAARLGLSAIADRETADTAFLVLHQLPGMLVEFLIGTLAWVWAGRRFHSAQPSPDQPSLDQTSEDRRAQAPVLSATVSLLGWVTLAVWFHAEGNEIERHLGVVGASLLAAVFSVGLILASLQIPLTKGMQAGCRMLGALSYPLYLVHIGPLKLWPSQPEAALALSLLIALLIHLFFEEPIRIWGRRVSERIQSGSEHIR